MYKQPKLFGKDEDGEYLGRIEQIGTSKDQHTLYISNRKPNLWLASLFNGYRQIGIFKTEPNKFKEGQDVIVIKKDNKIAEVRS